MVGKKLRKARESKGITIEEAHDQTKIHPHVLQALEEDSLENSLGTTYVKAFLRNYAGYLGLDVREIMREYTSTMVSEPPEQTVIREAVAKRAFPEDRDVRQIVIASVAILAWLIAIILATGKFVATYRSFTERRSVTATDVVTVRETERSVATTPSVQPMPERSSLKPARETAPPAKENFIPIPRRRTIVLTLATRRDVWLKVLQDGKVAFHGTLSKNSQETWRASEEIRLQEIGRPRALKFNINGQDIDIAGSRVGRKLLITHEGVHLERR